MAEFNKELLEKAKQANSPEELLALAKENDVEFTREQAEAYFEQMNKSGELSDDELDNVAGGTCYKGDRPITTIGNYCEFWTCKDCGGNDYDHAGMDGPGHSCNGGCADTMVTCQTCKYCKYEKAMWICYSPWRKK